MSIVVVDSPKDVIIDVDSQYLVRKTRFTPPELFNAPDQLDGSMGMNRVERHLNKMLARNDYEVIVEWLSIHGEKTRLSYKKEAERLLMWTIMSERKPLSSLTVADMVNYQKFLLVQPFVKNPGRDIRVLCINYHAVVAINRYAPEGGWITNTVAGGRPELAQLNNELIKIAEDASRACNTLISGVDVIEDISSGDYKILEVNSCPSAQPNFDLIGESPVFLFELARFLVYLLENFEDGLRNWKPSRLI